MKESTRADGTRHRSNLLTVTPGLWLPWAALIGHRKQKAVPLRAQTYQLAKLSTHRLSGAMSEKITSAWNQSPARRAHLGLGRDNQDYDVNDDNNDDDGSVVDNDDGDDDDDDEDDDDEGGSEQRKKEEKKTAKVSAVNCPWSTSKPTAAVTASSRFDLCSDQTDRLALFGLNLRPLVPCERE
ncbi:hypothetical protein ElyMa_003110700 [Elysia marginata]|uniref:Uncharacterized protein n=1 Tax=Elysia marginata TaxID=1093978 RepID=A0AAV4IQK2_9GAST|nr:hypothetical protein ElyMa_003110700 [Elysia marginata]